MKKFQITYKYKASGKGKRPMTPQIQKKLEKQFTTIVEAPTKLKASIKFSSYNPQYTIIHSTETE